MFPSPVRGPSASGFPTITVRGEDCAPGAGRGSWSTGDGRIDRTYSSRIKLGSNVAFGPIAAIQAIGVRIGDTYRYPLFSGGQTEQDTGSFAQSITPEQDSEDGKQWMVTIDYGPQDIRTLYGESHLSDGTLDPTERVWEVYWDSAKYELSKPTDNSSPPKYYKNTANDPLLDPPGYEETRPVLKLIHVEPRYNEALANSFRNTINSDVFLGCPPNTVKCREIGGEMLPFDPDWGIPWKITYEFEFRVDEAGDGFKQRILNAGLRYKKGGTGNAINADDGNGRESRDIVFLAKNGDKLADGADPILLDFTEFPSSDFSLLDIPQDILERSSW